MKKFFVITVIFLTVIVFTQCSKSDVSTNESIIDKDEVLSGGATTVFNISSKSFSFPLANLDASKLNLHSIGDDIFGATFVAPPAPIHAGIGPLFNNVSCTSCHNNDGRGRPPISTEPFNSMLFRISVNGVDIHGGPKSAPGFGLQVQTRAVFGVQNEMGVQINYTEVSSTYADGTVYSLRFPTYTPINSYIPIPATAVISPRSASPNFGLGLLEAIPEATIIGMADEFDSNNDGISGKPNYIWDDLKQTMALGRFGWKASQPTLLQQAAAAFNGDMGITSSYYPTESSDAQVQAVPAHLPEINDNELEALRFYLQTLAPPARRNVNDAVVQKGKQIFTSLNCSGCHSPKLTTGLVNGMPEISNQTIRPFTDLLLHDLGNDLADNRTDFKATGNEWRTPPLWGIGLTQIVNGHTFFLHDGRARNLTEAILWHGGEAEKAKNDFKKLSSIERDYLLKFVNSL